MPCAGLDDAALARRSVHGWCEVMAALGRCGPGLEEVRLPNAMGARAVDRSGPLASNHYFDAVVVPYDSAPPAAVRYPPLSCAINTGRQLWWGAHCCRRRFTCKVFTIYSCCAWVH